MDNYTILVDKYSTKDGYCTGQEEKEKKQKEEKEKAKTQTKCFIGLWIITSE